ncbi:MAG: 16S rRNA (guanine(966)-N(2))-methyltransferase RsmD [Rhodobacteraceae bacterium]|nr:16S rRNA (guanine(966)-N(2))-methyltransferase RsmD [Paracoccaceae bacterium]
MRIISGKFRGLTLASVGKGDQAAHLRPTSDRVRESIFNLLMNGGYGNPVDGARVLDLFAGTGALGLEALSRGAEFVALMDNGRVAGDLIRRNLGLCRLSADQAILLKRDATRPGQNDMPRFDLVFLDPPYGKGLGETALAAALVGGWLAPQALVVCEEAAEMRPLPGYIRLDARRYGDSWVTLLELA